MVATKKLSPVLVGRRFIRNSNLNLVHIEYNVFLKLNPKDVYIPRHVPWRLCLKLRKLMTSKLIQMIYVLIPTALQELVVSTSIKQTLRFGSLTFQQV